METSTTLKIGDFICLFSEDAQGFVFTDDTRYSITLFFLHFIYLTLLHGLYVVHQFKVCTHQIILAHSDKSLLQQCAKLTHPPPI